MSDESGLQEYRYLISVARGKGQEVYTQLRNMPEIAMVYLAIWEYDLVARVAVDSADQDGLGKKIRQVPGVVKARKSKVKLNKIPSLEKE